MHTTAGGVSWGEKVENNKMRRGGGWDDERNGAVVMSTEEHNDICSSLVPASIVRPIHHY